MSTVPNTTTPDQLVWPLPATSLPNAHLTWAEYQEWQAALLANAPAAVQSSQLSSPEMTQITLPFLSSGPDQRFAWPLPAAHLPNAHLTWAQWTAQQAARTDSGQPESVRRDRAA